MLDFDEAVSRLLQSVVRTGDEESPLLEAIGRVLAATLCAETDMPAFDYSAMDGYAVRREDFEGPGPWRLSVQGESRTGRTSAPLQVRTACRIFTGAEVPSGADCVVPQERVNVQGGVAEFQERPEAWNNVRRRAEDVRAGEVTLAPGTRLGPSQLALAAALDRAFVPVARRPRVTVVCTGDELRAPGSARAPGTIPESNSVAIAALCRRAAADVQIAPYVRDTTTELATCFDEALARSDLVITIGGASVGDYDLVKPALERARARVEFHKVNIKPGKPLLYAARGDTRVLGLPGNPVSAQVTCLLFAIPLLRAMQGDAAPRAPFRTATLRENVQHAPGRHSFLRARLEADEVVPLANQSSGAVIAMANSNALVHLPADLASLSAGERVRVLAFDDV